MGGFKRILVLLKHLFSRCVNLNESNDRTVIIVSKKMLNVHLFTDSNRSQLTVFIDISINKKLIFSNSNETIR